MRQPCPGVFNQRLLFGVAIGPHPDELAVVLDGFGPVAERVVALGHFVVPDGIEKKRGDIPGRFEPPQGLIVLAQAGQKFAPEVTLLRLFQEIRLCMFAIGDLTGS